MPIRKTERVKPISLSTVKKSGSHQRKPENQQIDLSLLENNNLFTRKTSEHIKYDNAKNIVNNIEISRFDKLIFSLIDYLNPFISKHPKIGEKILKFSDKLSGGIR